MLVFGWLFFNIEEELCLWLGIIIKALDPTNNIPEHLQQQQHNISSFFCTSWAFPGLHLQNVSDGFTFSNQWNPTCQICCISAAAPAVWFPPEWEAPAATLLKGVNSRFLLDDGGCFLLRPPQGCALTAEAVYNSPRPSLTSVVQWEWPASIRPQCGALALESSWSACMCACARGLLSGLCCHRGRC